MTFDIHKYVGKWYQLITYPMWFQRSDNYNTTAEYTLLSNGEIQIVNSTISRGRQFQSIGRAYQMDEFSLRVDFPDAEINRLIASGEFNLDSGEISSFLNQALPNYVIKKIWINKYGEYLFSVITDPTKQTLYVLSRYENPSLEAYNQIMTYVLDNFDRDRLVQVPHFH